MSDQSETRRFLSKVETAKIRKYVGKVWEALKEVLKKQ